MRNNQPRKTINTNKNKPLPNEYEQLERLLKASKEKFSGVLVENLSKLAFFQPQKKMTANPLSFASYVLTGGACLIMRHCIYHNDVADAIYALAHELKLSFANLVIQNKTKVACDAALFDIFVDYEANIIIQVLQLAIKSGIVNLEVIPTPGYLIHYDAISMRVGQHFLPWLAAQDQELFEMYHVNTFYAVLWVFNGKKIVDIQKILKAAPKESFNPYLRLAILMRAEEIKKTAMNGIVKPDDFKKFDLGSHVFEDILIKTIKLIPESWRMLLEFKTLFRSTALKDIVMSNLLCKLQAEYEDNTSVSLELIKNVVQQMGAVELEKSVNDLFARQQECLAFLSKLAICDGTKKAIKSITNLTDLRKHLTLIMDTVLLNFPELNVEYFLHLVALKQSKKINRLLSLQQIFDDKFGCTCPKCFQHTGKKGIIRISQELNLQIVDLTRLNLHFNVMSTPQSSALRTSVLLQQDPFQILGVSVADSKQIIIQKVMKLMQQVPEQMSILRQAQSELFNPAQRFLHHYLRFVAYESNNLIQMHTSKFKVELADVN